MTIFAIIHTACHLMGSFRILAENKNLEQINDHLAVKAFDRHYSYVQLLFTTIPGITGIILFLWLMLMAITSMRCVRMKWFQIFGYIHMTLFPIFMIALIIHGFGFWFRLGTPFAIIIVTPCFIMMIIQQLMRIFSSAFYHFEVIDVSISSDWVYAMIYFEKPKNYKLVHGQYVFINVPEVNSLQWHPFTVASSPSNPYLILMIKKAGDWTGKFIRLLYEKKKEMMKFDEFQVGEYSEYDIFNVLHDLYQEIPLNEMQTRNKLFFPKVKISRAWATPNDTFISRKNVVMIGAGSGISPYLPLLEEVVKHKNRSIFPFKFELAKLIFVAREGEQISWLSNFLFHILNAEWLTEKLEFSIFITLEKNVQTLPSFLFWRSFLLIGQNKKLLHK